MLATFVFNHVTIQNSIFIIFKYTYVRPNFQIFELFLNKFTRLSFNNIFMTHFFHGKSFSLKCIQFYNFLKTFMYLNKNSNE